MLRKDGSVTISLRNFVGEGIIKPVDCESEVKVRWHMFGEPRLYGNGETDLITQTWLKFNCK